MKKWTERTKEEANLFNPAFCSQLMTASIVGYLGEKQQGMPFTLSFLVLPMILYKPTRDILPRDTRTSFVNWIQENQTIKINMHVHILSLKSYTREAIIMGTQHNIIDIDPNGNLLSTITKSTIEKNRRKMYSETSECLNKAFLVGRWFALAGAPHFIFTLLGIKP